MNVNGLKGPGRFKKLLDDASREHQADPVFAFTVQEHNIPRSEKGTFQAKALYRGFIWISAHSQNGGRGTGTGILIPKNSIERKDDDETETQAIARIKASAGASRCGRVCSVRLAINGRYIRVTSAYAHPDSHHTERPRFFTHTLAPFVTKHTILALDANCVPEPSLDLKRPNSTTPYCNTGADELSDLVSQKGLIDVAREQLGASPLFTSHHTTANGEITHTRIDQIYVPHVDAMTWVHAPLQSFMAPPAESTTPPDHIALQVSLLTPEGKKGSDMQYINERIFETPEHITEVAKIIASHYTPPTDPDAPPPPNALATLLSLKRAVREYAMQATTAMRKRDTDEAAILKMKIRLANQAIREGGGKEHLEKLSRARTALRDLAPEARTLNDTIEEQAYQRGMGHDSGSAAMYRAITPRSSDQWVNAMRKADWTDPSNPVWEDERVTDPKKIPNELERYYRQLFAMKVIDRESLQLALAALREGRKVLPPTADKCGAKMTPDEVAAVSKVLPTGKSPGPDRLPNAFYKNFADLLAPLLAAAFNEAHEKGELPPEMREGLISVLYKKKDRADPRNYRPITLLNGDYKIMMRILTQRMNEAIVQFVSDVQNGFTPNSFIAENTHLLKLLQAYVELDPDDDEGAIFLFLDMEKAFDRCSWEFLHMALPEIGFAAVDLGDGNSRPHPFQQWVSLAYNSQAPPTRRMVVNGYMSRPFPLASGVAQGCPLSPLLFIVFTEVLSRLAAKAAVEGGAAVGIQHPPLKGIEVDGRKHYISQFADDTAYMMRPSDVVLVERITEVYCGATCGKENVSKREAVLVGTVADSTSHLYAQLPSSIRDGVPPPREVHPYPRGTFRLFLRGSVVA